MRVKLVLDATELARLVYKDEKTLESMKIGGKEEEPTKDEEEPKEEPIKDEEDAAKDEEESKDEKARPEEDSDDEAENTIVQTDVKIEEHTSAIQRLTKPISFYSSHEDAQCLYTQYEDGACFVFRGTTSKKDWMINLDATQDPLNLTNVFGKDRPRVHGGFLRQFQSVVMSLMKHASDYMADKSIKDSNKTFYYIGHSLGGALSTIAALVFGIMYPDARHVCITFGSPRVGDARFCELFKEHVDECVRSVNQEDPVPMVPTACRYEHVYGLAYIDKNNDIQREMTENRLLNTCKDSFLCCCGVGENPLDDHDMTQYREAWLRRL